MGFFECLSALYTKDALVAKATLVDRGESLKITEFKVSHRILNCHDWTRHLRPS